MSRPESDRNSDETIPAGGDASGHALVRAGLRRGDVVGRYVVLGRLGAGGMGVVYAAYDPGLDRKVALKLLHPERDTGEGRRLLREAQAMARLAHPNAVAVHDVGEHEGTVFLAMEYVEGTTLRHWLEKRSRSWRVVLRAFVQAGRGLGAAHGKGLVHRDFKPDNVMVDDEGADADDGPARVRVLDFGLARGERAAVRVRIDVDARAIDTDARSGTPAYMAPEQFHGAPVDAAADQFAFCVALYEGLYGERPFEGGSIAALVDNVTTGRVRTTSARSDVPAWLRRVIERGLAVDAKERWPSMDALLRALEHDPTRRRRTAVGIAAAVAIVGAVAGVREVERARNDAACEEQGEPIAEIWSAAFVDATQAAFAGSSVPYASDAWGRARVRFDAFVEAWTQTRVEVCRGATVDHTRSGRSLELAEDCLAEQRGRFEAIAGQLADASPRAVERSIEWSLGLPDPRQCIDDDVLARRTTPPSDPAVRTDLVAVHRDVAAVQAMVQAGKIEEARALSDELGARAAALDWPSALAMAALARADALEGAGELAEAEAALKEAFRVAGRAGDDALALEAAGKLAYVVGHELARTSEGLAWGEVAQTFVERLGLPEHDPSARRVLNAVAALRMDAGAIDESVALHARLVAIAREHLGEDHPSLAMALGNLGAAEFQRGRHRDALALFEESLAIKEHAFGPTHPSVASTLVNVAAAHSRLGHGDDAVATSRRALEMRIAIYGPDHASVVGSQSMLAGNLADMGRYEEAVAVAREALAGQRRTLGERHPDVAGTLQNLGYSYARLGRADESIAALTEAIGIFRSTRGPDHRATALAVHALAEAYASASRIDEARASYREALAVLEVLPDERRHTASVLSSLGGLELEAGELESALALCERAMQMLATVESARDLAYARGCVAGASWRLGRDQEHAIELVRQARDQLARSRPRVVARLDAWLEQAAPGGPPPPSLRDVVTDDG